MRPLLYKNLRLPLALAEYIVPVVQTLVSDPSLGSLVQTLHISAWKTCPIRQGLTGEGHEYEDMREGLLQADLESVLKKAEQIWPADEGDKWMHDLKSINLDAWVGLLLAILPNLSRLEIQFPWGSKYVPRVVAGAGKGEFSTPVLQSLSEVYASINVWDKNLGLPISDALPFLSLPFLRGFHGHCLADCEATPSQIISNCPNLVAFRCYQDCSAYGDPQYPLTAYHAILSVKETLETLWVDMDHSLSEYRGDSIVLPSLIEFASLKALHLPVYCMVNLYSNQRTALFDLSDTIPCSVEKVHLTGVTREALHLLMPRLTSYIESGTERRIRLAELAIEMQYNPRDTIRIVNFPESQSQAVSSDNRVLADRARRLKAACADANIALLIDAQRGETLLFDDPDPSRCEESSDDEL